MASSSSDIRFYPSSPAGARILSEEQIAHFNEKGYISPLDALTKDETIESRKYFDGLLELMASFKDGRNAYAIMGYHNKCRGIWDLAQHPKILDYVEDLLGPDFVCWSSHYFCKVPHESKRVPWHQDATYWPVRPTKTVTAWLAIDDVDLENAPMRFMPGSHLNGKIDWEPATGDAALTQEIPNPERFGEPFNNVMRAGQISLHTSTLVHGSEPNQSSRRRCGLTYRYLPTDCGVVEGTERLLHDAIVCRGDANHWVRTARPPTDDLNPIHRVYMDS